MCYSCYAAPTKHCGFNSNAHLCVANFEAVGDSSTYICVANSGSQQRPPLLFHSLWCLLAAQPHLPDTHKPLLQLILVTATTVAAGACKADAGVQLALDSLQTGDARQRRLGVHAFTVSDSTLYDSTIDAG